MAFTEQDLKDQQQEITRLAEELNRLNADLAAHKKSLGLAEDEEVIIDDADMTPELEQAMAEATEAARRAGSARAAQAKPATTVSSGAGRGRRGAMRI
ncbi:MAG: hypothetical protein IJB29_01350 [Mailhella sp.]|nr:hypothetical protein [Mailhella sp.]